MRKSFVALAALAGILLGSGSLAACGDKLVLLGRGIRFQRMIATKNPATILVYLNPGAGIASADREYQLRSLLKLAGHKPRSVATTGELTREIDTGGYDLVLADYSDVAALKQMLPAKSKAGVIPVMYNPTVDQRAEAEKEYSCLVTPAKKNYDLLKVIDQAMTARPESTVPKCPKNRA